MRNILGPYKEYKSASFPYPAFCRENLISKSRYIVWLDEEKNCWRSVKLHKNMQELHSSKEAAMIYLDKILIEKYGCVLIDDEERLEGLRSLI